LRDLSLPSHQSTGHAAEIRLRRCAERRPRHSGGSDELVVRADATARTALFGGYRQGLPAAHGCARPARLAGLGISRDLFRAGEAGSGADRDLVVAPPVLHVARQTGLRSGDLAAIPRPALAAGVRRADQHGDTDGADADRHARPVRLLLVGGSAIARSWPGAVRLRGLPAARR